MTPVSARDSKRTRSEQLRRRVSTASAGLVLLFVACALGPAQAEYVPVALSSTCNEYSDAFDDPYSPPRGFFAYYEESSVTYNGVPFNVEPATSPPTFNVVSTPVHDTATVELPVPHARLAHIYFLGVGTWLADYLGHQPLWCDDPSHFWFRVRYEDGSYDDLFPVDVATGLPRISDILQGEGAVASFPASPIGYVHMYELTPDDKVVAGLSLRDNCSDPPGDFTILALTVETSGPDDIVFEDDFSGTSIDPAKWRVYGRHAYPQHDGEDPWWLYTFWKQDDSLQLRVTHQNLVWIVARSAQQFGEECTSYEVEVWQDDVSGWQDWPIGFITPYSKFGYYNHGWHWTIEWTGADGGHRLVQNIFPEPFQPWVHYRLKVAREGDELRWYLDDSDGTGYRLVYSTTDFSFPFLFPHPVYHITLDIEDLGTTYYDNIVVRGRPSATRENILFVSDRSGNRDIWIMEADGGNPQQLTTNPGLDDMPVPVPPNFWPTGPAIAYVSDEGNPAPGPDELPNTDIWLMNPDGSNKRRLTNELTAYCSQPQWSDDGCHVVYVKKRDGQAPELWRVNAVTATDRRLTDTGVTHKNPEWCAGYEIVYDKDTGGGGWWELFRMDPNGSNQQALATSHHSISPACAHGGSKPEGGPVTRDLAYVRVLTSTSQVRAIRADGADDRLVRDNSSIAYDGWGQVAWSPDDSLLAASIYPSRHPGVTEFESFVQIVDPITGAESYRTTEGRNAFALESSLYNGVTFSAGDRVWNGGGSRLVFMSDRDGNWEIYTMAPDGNGQVNLSQSPAWDGSPCWISLVPSPNEVVQVEIDIKPGSECNPVNPTSQGVLPVAVFSSVDFDATDIDSSTVLLAGAPVAQNPDDGGWMIHEQDENGDDLMDVRLHFETEQIDTELLDGEYAMAAGMTYGGLEFQGRDNVTIVPEDIPNDHWAIESIAECLKGKVVKGYPDGLYRPDLAVSRDQMAVFVARAMAGGEGTIPAGPLEPTFSDVSADHWAYDAIEYAVAEGVIAGYDNGTYQPEWIVSRAQMPVFIARAEGWVGIDDNMNTAPALFPDVPAGHWAGTAIQACVEYGVVSGYPDGYYCPTWDVTRDQMAIYIARAFELAT